MAKAHVRAGGSLDQKWIHGDGDREMRTDQRAILEVRSTELGD